MKSITVLILLVFSQIATFAQTYDKKYSESVEEINEYLLVNEFSDALPILNKLENEGYTNANIYYKLGKCYLNSVFEKTKAVSYLERASRNTTVNYNIDNTLEQKAPLEVFLFLGDAYRVNNRLKDAEIAYKKYQSLIKDKPKEQEIARKRIFESQMAQLFIMRPAKIRFEKLKSSVNTGLGNFNVCISGDGKSMVFNRKMKFYDALFFSTQTEGDWTEPKEITVNVGSDGEFHPTGLSPDGKRMLLTSYNHFTGFDVYESVFRDGKWRKVKLLNKSVNSAFYDIDAVYSADGKEIYFSSNRTSGFGGFDIFKASIDDSGNIGEAENLGSTINTEWDEKSPAIADGGKMLFLSSQRKPCMGGSDFFYSKLGSDGKWGLVYNAGYPLSTVGEDFGLSTKLQASEGVMAKYEAGSGTESDIFNVYIDVLSQFRLVSLKGEVKMTDKDSTSYKGLNLYFVDETIKDTVGMVESPEGGRYKIDLYPGDFKLVMTKDSVGSVSQKFSVPSDEAKPDFQLISDFSPESKKPMVRPEIIAYDTVFVADILFDFDKSTISLKEKDNINKLVNQLKNHFITKIELVGFTDCLGNKEYNKVLSENRAANVKELLVNKGIAAEKLLAKGMADAVLIARNKNADGSDNPEGRAFNRRVEIHIFTSDRNLVIIKKDLVPAQLKP